MNVCRTCRSRGGWGYYATAGINVDRVPGPRGPVTFRDLYLRQFVVTPA